MSSDATANLSLRPPRRRTLTEAVAQQLLEQIREQKLAPGTKMPSERELMNVLRVGRSTVREALNGLALLGVIEVRHGQGAFVAAIPAESSPDELAAALAKGVTQELLEARRVVELETARLAAERSTPADLRNINAVLKRHRRALERGEICAPHSARFHLEIAEAGHNDVLAGFVASLLPLLEELGPELESMPGYREWELDQHVRLFEAIESGEPERAAEQMRTHLAEMVGQHNRLRSETPR